MPYSPEELQSLMAPPDFSPVTDQILDGPTGVKKKAMQVANIVPKAGNLLAESFVGLGQAMRPDLDMKPLMGDAKTALPSFDVGPNTGLGDTLLNDVAPEIASWMIPYAGASKVMKGVGLVGRAGTILSEGLAQGGANALTGLRSEEGTPVASGAMGVASGIISAALPRWERALPLAAVSALTYGATGNAVEAAGNFVGNMLPGAAKADFSKVTKPVLQASKVPQTFESVGMPGEFKFMDDVPQASSSGSILPREQAAPYDTTLPSVVQPPDTLTYTSAEQLNGLKLKGPEQLELRLPEAEAPVTPSGLKLDKLPVEDLPAPSVEAPGSKMELQNPNYVQSEFDPLFKLQSERPTPGLSAPSEFKFMDDVPVKPIDNTGDLFSWKPKEAEPLKLKTAADEQLGLDFPEPVEPTGLKLDKSLRTPELTEGSKVPASGLSLEGAKYSQGELDPLLTAQSTVRTPPGAAPVEFKFMDNVPVRTLDNTGDLFQWAKEKAPATQEGKFPFKEHQQPELPLENAKSPLLPSPVTPPEGGFKYAQPARILNRPAEDAEQMVKIKIPEFEGKWSSTPSEKDLHIAPGGGGEIKGRRANFIDWLNKNPGKAIETPEVSVNSKGEPTFSNGRHRYSVLRDSGEKTMSVSMSPESVANARKAGLLLEDAKSSSPVDAPLSVGKIQRITGKGKDGVWNVEIDGQLHSFSGSKGHYWYEGGDKSPLVTGRILSVTSKEHAAQEIAQLMAAAKKAAPEVLESAKTPIGDGPPVATRAKDFKDTGSYDVEYKGKRVTIFRDPESKWWYIDGPQHYSERVISTESKADALAEIARRWEHPNLRMDTFVEHAAKNSARDAEAAPLKMKDNFHNFLEDMTGSRKGNFKGVLSAKDQRTYFGDVLFGRKEIRIDGDAGTVKVVEKVSFGQDANIETFKFEDLASSKPGKGMKLGGSEAGAIDKQTLLTLAGAGAVGLITYKETKGDMGATIALSLAALGLGLKGASAFRALREHVGPGVNPLPKTVIPGESIKAKLSQFAKDTAHTPGGFAVGGRGGIQAGIVRLAEGLTGLNGSPLFRDRHILADGFIADQLEVLTKAFNKVKSITPTPGFGTAVSHYLRGQLADIVSVKNILNSHGLDSEAFKGLDSASKAHYPEKWIVWDDVRNTNTSGPGVTVYHVTNQAKANLVQLQKNALDTMAVAPQDREFMAFALQSRETIDNLMQTLHAAIPSGQRLNTVLGTMGQYVSRSHELLTNPAYYPDEVTIQKAMDRLGLMKEARFFDQAHATTSPVAGSVPVTWQGATYHVTPSQAHEFEYLHTPESLRSLVTQYIKEIKQVNAGKGKGLISKDTEQLGSSPFAQRQELDNVTQTLLGTHDTPLKMIQQTINKLVPSAKAAHFMTDLIQLPDAKTGLRMAYPTEGEYNEAMKALKADMSRPNISAVDLQHAKNQYQALSSYIPMSGQDANSGLFAGSYVSRAAHDQLKGFDNPFGILDNAIGKGMSNFNNLIKETHLILNPIVHVRNMIQIPLFLAMGGAATEPMILKTAFDALKDPTSIIGRRLVQNGVTSGNPIHGEFNHGLRELLDGSADNAITAALKKGRQFLHGIYAFPDDYVRAATYLAAESRSAKKFGVSVDAGDYRVMEEARLFMSRRTMDYANVPQIIKIGRQVPLVSMFLSYTHEILRVSSNMAVDAINGDLAAGATLAGIGSLPFLLQKNAESQLSPEDLKAWNIGKDVAQDYSRPRFKMPMSRNKDGSFNYIDITPLLPQNDFQMMIKAVASGDLESAKAVNPYVGLEKTPLLSMFAEQITGKEIHSGKEFRDNWDRAAAIAKALVPPHTPGIGNEWIKSTPEALGGTLGVTNTKNGRTNTGIGALLRNFIGVDYTQVDTSMATRNFIRGAQHDLANEKQYFLDTMRMDGLSSQAKERAEQRFIEAVHHITQSIESRIK